MKEKVYIEIKGGKVKMDFEGFSGGSCSNEEALIRFLLARLGLSMEISQSERKERQGNGTAEQEKVKA